ncbi:hypothetical protein ACS0TY_027780 [Phlomoides rotata]
MNEGKGERRWCCFHPKEMVVGICALCLNERLSILASKQSHLQQISLTPKWGLPKIFALTSLLTLKQHKSHEVHDTSSPCSQDSFISIKFEDNGVASWDKGKISKMSHDEQCEMSSMKMKTVIEHAKPRTAMRWRRRIGHLFQLSKWKRSSKGNVCHVGTKLEGAKVKYGWIRSLTKRRTKE